MEALKKGLHRIIIVAIIVDSMFIYVFMYNVYSIYRASHGIIDSFEANSTNTGLAVRLAVCFLVLAACIVYEIFRHRNRKKNNIRRNGYFRREIDRVKTEIAEENKKEEEKAKNKKQYDDIFDDDEYFEGEIDFMTGNIENEENIEKDIDENEENQKNDTEDKSKKRNIRRKKNDGVRNEMNDIKINDIKKDKDNDEESKYNGGFKFDENTDDGNDIGDSELHFFWEDWKEFDEKINEKDNTENIKEENNTENNDNNDKE